MKNTDKILLPIKSCVGTGEKKTSEAINWNKSGRFIDRDDDGVRVLVVVTTDAPVTDRSSSSRSGLE